MKRRMSNRKSAAEIRHNQYLHYGAIEQEAKQRKAAELIRKQGEQMGGK